MYLTIITIGMCAAYVALFLILSKFFKNKFQSLNPNWLYSIFLIIVFSAFAHYISLLIPGDEFSNRVLHAFGGGFTAFLVYYLAVKDSKLNITKFQFFVLGFLVVSTLGVVNEMSEFFLQNNFELIFAPNINDTWQDLVSNTVGALIAAITFTPLRNKNA